MHTPSTSWQPGADWAPILAGREMNCPLDALAIMAYEIEIYYVEAEYRAAVAKRNAEKRVIRAYPQLSEAELRGRLGDIHFGYLHGLSRLSQVDEFFTEN